LDYLSNIELYYTSPSNCKENKIRVEGDEYKHIIKVMRHSVNDLIHITDGVGHIFKCRIIDSYKDYLDLSIEKILSYESELSNITFCIPKLKNPERFEFALEKSTELGITNFIVFESLRAVSKANKIDRWNKILLSAMKQSLRSFLPKLEVINSFYELIEFEGEKFIFEQSSEIVFKREFINQHKKYLFIFGPEGGLTDEEIKSYEKENLFRIAENRLRTETAIIKCASILTKL